MKNEVLNLGETLAFIPARGGSKSIALKNIKKINGRPLIYWVLDAIEKVNEIDRIVVSTDSEKIRQIVNDYDSNKLTVIERSEKVSTDIATTESAMLEFAQQFNFKNIILIQATSPLLSDSDLRNGLQIYNKNEVDSVLSVVNQKRFIWKKVGSLAESVNYKPLERPRRQEFDGYYVENGAFYITSRENLIKSGCRISGNIAFSEMPEETYFEIDEINDWLIVEGLLQNKFGKYQDYSEKIKRIRCVITDCDGVLTDGGMYYSEKGDELKKFNTRDGMGFQLLRENGYITGMITGENSLIACNRAKKLKLDLIYTGVKDKLSVLNEILKINSLTYQEIAYIGDDINDLEVLNKVGFSCTVSDANEQIKKNVDYVTISKGGEGAVREVIELILENNCITGDNY